MENKKIQKPKHRGVIIKLKIMGARSKHSRPKAIDVTFLIEIAIKQLYYFLPFYMLNSSLLILI